MVQVKSHDHVNLFGLMNGVKSRFWSPLCTAKILSGAMDLISPCNSWVCVMSWTHTCESWGAIFIHSCHISDEKWSGAGDKNGSGKTCFVSIYYISSFSHYGTNAFYCLICFKYRSKTCLGVLWVTRLQAVSSTNCSQSLFGHSRWLATDMPGFATILPCFKSRKCY